MCLTSSEFTCKWMYGWDEIMDVIMYFIVPKLYMSHFIQCHVEQVLEKAYDSDKLRITTTVRSFCLFKSMLMPFNKI